MVRRGKAGPGAAWQGKARQGLSILSRAGRGLVWPEERFIDSLRRGGAGHGQARPGMARRGEAGQGEVMKQ
jgi:hypothetical protein